MEKNFTTFLYNETKYYHKEVDNHPFTDLIMTDKEAGNIYINFNKICILHLQKTLNLNNKILQEKLYKEINVDEIDLYNNDNLKKLLKLCEEYPFEHLYLFILGIIKGGNILKKYISEEHHNFLTFNNSKELSIEFKNYINDNVNDEYKKNFIEIVKNTYEIIKLCFDDFYLMRQ